MLEAESNGDCVCWGVPLFYSALDSPHDKIFFFLLFGGEEGSMPSEAESKKLIDLKQIKRATISPSPPRFFFVPRILTEVVNNSRERKKCSYKVVWLS